MILSIYIDCGMGGDSKQREEEVRHEIEQLLAKGEKFNFVEDEDEVDYTDIPEEEVIVGYTASYIY